MEKKQSRKRLRPWLERHCNKNTFQGLKWIDKEKMMFKISWRHQSNRAWESSDAEIFKAWALFSGKFKEGDTETPPEWKTRLRTALTKLSDVEEMKDMHKLSDTENPYRVYRFLSDEEVSHNKIRQHESPSSDFEMASCSPTSFYQTSPDSQTEFLDGFFDKEGALTKNNMHGNSSNIPTVVYDGEISHPIDHVMSDVNQSEGMNDFTNSNHEPFVNIAAGPSNIPLDLKQEVMEPNYMMSEMHSKLPSDLEGLDSNSLRSLNNKITDPMSIGSSLPSVDTTMNPKVRIDVYFVDQLVMSELFDEKGARLFCGDPPIHCLGHEIFGPENLKQISVPDIDRVNKPHLSIKEKEKDLIRDIQKNMERGLLLGCDHTSSIYAQRLCKARVFWDQEGKGTRLDRESNRPVCVFDFQNFAHQLQAYITGDSHSQPSSSVSFSFGQDYKADSPGKRHVLLHAKVTHLEAETLLKDNNEQHNSEVLISNSNSGDLLAALLKEKVSLQDTCGFSFGGN